jgi:hypothetical protein
MLEIVALSAMEKNEVGLKYKTKESSKEYFLIYWQLYKL